MIYKMLTGTFPYHSDSEEQLNLRMQSGDIQIESEDWTKKVKPSKTLNDLVRGMLETNVSKRYTAEQCIKSLDIWINELREQIKAEFDKKGKPYPANLKPLADEKLIKQTLKNFVNFEAKSIAKVSIYNFFAKEMLTNQEKLVVT